MLMAEAYDKVFLFECPVKYLEIGNLGVYNLKYETINNCIECLDFDGGDTQLENFTFHNLSEYAP